jgi:uncharacterized protein (UPF0332 family)
VVAAPRTTCYRFDVDRKARENLVAAKLLLDREDPCTNAAASRAYYAAYHALWSLLEESGEEAPEVRPGARYFPHQAGGEHESIADAADRCRALTSEEILDLERLWDFRVKADYHPDDVVAEEAQACIETAIAIVARVDAGEPT